MAKQAQVDMELKKVITSVASYLPIILINLQCLRVSLGFRRASVENGRDIAEVEIG